MTVVVTHTTPADSTFSSTGAAAWNANHALAGVGTMAEQDANNVAITGGTINNTTIGATTPAAGTFTTLTAQNETLVGTGQNLILFSENLTNANWSGSGTTASIISTAFASNTSQLVQTTSAFFKQDATSISGGVSGKTYTVSAWLWSTTSTGQVGLRLAGTSGASGAVLTVNLTSTPTRYSITGTFSAVADTYPQIVFDNRSFAGGDGVAKTYLVWGAQLSQSSSAGTYIPTTTTAVYGTPTLSFSGVASIGLQSDGSLYHQPAGTGAVQAQATTSSATGGNARGANAVDWSTKRDAGAYVASGGFSVISGGASNVAQGTLSFVGGGQYNTGGNSYSTQVGGFNNSTGGAYSFGGSGNTNVTSGQYASTIGGLLNNSQGYLNFIGGGSSNSANANAAVTTQSATMNGTTAVTLAASNANIKVGQLITGTSIVIGSNTTPFTYVAAISGTSLTLSQVASGSSTSTLSFFTPHGVVVGGGNNQATGSYSYIGGGGDAGTAANRNVASGDYAVVVGGVKNVASGLGAVVVGGGVYSTSTGPTGNTASNTGAGVVSGFTNTSSGYVSFIGAGQLNTASGDFASVTSGYTNTSNGALSFIGGGAYGTTRNITGYQVMPACNSPIASSSGVTQAGLLVLAVQTTDATATVLRSNSSAASTTNQVILPNNSAYYFKVEIIANVTGGGNTSGWELKGVIKRGANAASTAIVGSVTSTLIAQDAGASTWVVSATADTTNGGLKITVTGQASTTIRWVAKASTTEVTF